MLELSQGNALPVLPLRDIVVFPHMIVPLFVGREKSVRALEDVMKNDKQILLVTQKNAAQDDPTPLDIYSPTPLDIYSVGTIGTVLQLLKLPDGTVKVLVEGGQRARIVKYTDNEEFFEAEAALTDETSADEPELEALARTVVTQFEQYIKLNKKIPPEVLVSINQIDDPSKLADTVASHLSLKIPEKQELLETPTVTQRLEKVYAFMEGEIGVQVRKTKFSKEAREKATGEIKKLRSMSPMSAEATVVRNYLDWLLGIPWKKRTRARIDLNLAQEILDRDHYGLEKVKERILEYLAVQKRMGKVKGPILCLVGPPGVGKTSLGKSVATSTGRNFVRMSLGGVRDEAEIRGHRRTYIGSMPGKIVQGMKKAKSSNPLFLLDEIDKLGADWRGDPSSALLEVLDPEQNNSFNDHYLEVDYDLSDVMFITTANTLRMPQPLLDRMEVIRIPGYTEDEKVEIAQRHLLPKQTKQNGLKENEWSISTEALRDLIRYYTREAGVRNLERELASLLRKAVKVIAMGEYETVRMTRRNLEKFAGVRRYRYGEAEQEAQVGLATGLAWTEVGGELLSIEAVTVRGKGKVVSTGKLGEVMKESIQAAESFVKSRSVAFGIKPTLFERKDIHVHVPEGATPKDGPSAGVAMVTAIVSVLTETPVRHDVAMTGEITLRGRVLPIGGLKEKLLAALRGNIRTVLIPDENEKDLAEVPDNVKKGMKIIPCRTIEDVLQRALTTELKPIDWIESDEVEAVPSEKPAREGVVTH
jgi:ATP-dependent Lon protease